MNKKIPTIQFSNLPRKVDSWYEKPLSITIKIKKSTLVILLLIIYIIWSHVTAHALILNNSVPLHQIKPLKTITERKVVPKSFKQIAPIEEAVAAPETISGCGDNQWANYIYMHESDCSTYDPNPTTGACGIGQANPCSKMPCGHSASDYACQNAFFTQYANERYGGWQGAYNFWVQNQWW